MKIFTQKINTRTAGIGIVNNNNLRERVLRILLVFLGALALGYVFLLGNMVFNIVERRTAEAEANVLSNKVRELELQYLSMSNEIDLSLAASMGFQETKAKFATRQSLGSLKLAKNEL